MGNSQRKWRIFTVYSDHDWSELFRTTSQREAYRYARKVRNKCPALRPRVASACRFSDGELTGWETVVILRGTGYGERYADGLYDVVYTGHDFCPQFGNR